MLGFNVSKVQRTWGVLCVRSRFLVGHRRRLLRLDLHLHPLFCIAGFKIRYNVFYSLASQVFTTGSGRGAA